MPALGWLHLHVELVAAVFEVEKMHAHAGAVTGFDGEQHPQVHRSRFKLRCGGPAHSGPCMRLPLKGESICLPPLPEVRVVEASG